MPIGRALLFYWIALNLIEARPQDLGQTHLIVINLFSKLKKENLLKQKGNLLDLGCGNGIVSEPFLKYGYRVTLVDKDVSILSEAENNLKKIKQKGFKIINSPIEQFNFSQTYDGIVISNVLPFQKDKAEIARIVMTAWEKVNNGGFFFFTLFGTEDQWAEERTDSMSFHNKEEVFTLIEKVPYFVSEDYGQGITMKGDIKIWHVFYLLYVK